MWRFLCPNLRNGSDAVLIPFLFLFVGLLTQILGVKTGDIEKRSGMPYSKRFMKFGKGPRNNDDNQFGLNQKDDTGSRRDDLETKSIHSGKDGNEKRSDMPYSKRFRQSRKSLNNDDDGICNLEKKD